MIAIHAQVVNCGELLSKWVGESTKNIEAIFEEARHSDAILVFDESEGLFGSRTSMRYVVYAVDLLPEYVRDVCQVCDYDVFIVKLAPPLTAMLMLMWECCFIILKDLLESLSSLPT